MFITNKLVISSITTQKHQLLEIFICQTTSFWTKDLSSDTKFWHLLCTLYSDQKFVFVTNNGCLDWGAMHWNILVKKYLKKYLKKYEKVFENVFDNSKYFTKVFKYKYKYFRILYFKYKYKYKY